MKGAGFQGMRERECVLSLSVPEPAYRLKYLRTYPISATENAQARHELLSVNSAYGAHAHVRVLEAWLCLCLAHARRTRGGGGGKSTILTIP